MRESCIDCVRKHIAQALILLTESKLGHPEYKWLAVGHLAEAEAESVLEFEGFANKVRTVRLSIIEDDYEIYLLKLIREAGELEKNVN
jgi:hypothetical protein